MFQQSRFAVDAGNRAPKLQWTWIAGIIAILTLIFSYNVSAQVSTGDILGTVQDQTGAVLSNATVRLQSLDTNEVRTAVSDRGGNYTFTLLPPGPYTISVNAQGFKQFTVDSLSLSGGDRARINPRMEVGKAQETVEVSAVEPALQTDSASLGAVVTSKAVQDLPLNGRNFVQLAQLAPGANEGPQSSIGSGQRPDDRRQSSAISANGQSDLANEQLLDGIDNNDSLIGVLGARPSIEAIAEMRVITSLFPAEIGHTGGAAINIVTKSGTTQFHGSLYEFLRNDKFDAWDPFVKIGNAANPLIKKPEYRQNQFGGSIGGPIPRMAQTFFFGDYEAIRNVQGQPSVTTVPTLYEEQNPGDFTDIGSVKLGRLDPVGLNYFKLFPKPTLAAPVSYNNFISSPNNTQNGNDFDIRGDHSFKNNDHLFVRETYNNVSSFYGSILPNVASIAGLTDVDPGGNPFGYTGPSSNIAHNAVVGYTHMFTSNLIGDFRAGYIRVSNQAGIPNVGKNVSQAFGLQGVNVNNKLTGLTPLLLIGYAGLGDSAFLPIVDTSNNLEYNGTISYVRGTNSFKVGVDYVRRGGRSQQDSFGLGFDVFIPLVGNNTLATLLSGLPVSVSRSNQINVPNFRRSQISEFAQDDWHVNKWLTLNLGARYDIFTPISETSNHLSLFDTSTLQMLIAGQNGVSRTVNVKTDYSNLAPRIGFEISATPKTVVRGGFGMSYQPLGQITMVANNAPEVSAYSPNPFTVGLDTPFPTIQPGSTTNLSGGMTAMDRNFKNEYVEQFALDIQQQVGANVFTVGYVGELGQRLYNSLQIDAIPLTDSPNYLKMRPYYNQLPNVTGIGVGKAQGSSNYHALQAIAERRTSQGLTVNANYTYARNLGDVNSYSDTGMGAMGVVPALFHKLDYGNSDLDVRQRITLQINYALPFAKEAHGLVGIVAKGWQANAIYFWQTGTPFTLVNSSGRANPGSPTDRPNEIGNPNVGSCANGSKVHTRGCWFNASVFVPQQLGTVGVLDGTAGASGTIGPWAERRNQLYGPNDRRLDLSVFKNWKVEGSTLQFRAETFNLTNTPSYGQPDNTLGDAGVGTLTSLRVGSYPRQIQFALKLTF
jgi:hypothetical protein